MLVARNGAQYLPRTIAALAAQTRRPDAVHTVDAGSNDASGTLLGRNVATTPGRRTFGGAIAWLDHLAPATGVDDEWLWLLGHDNAPEPGALSALLGAVEVAPSVAIAGPKLMRWDDPHVIASFGETITPLGASVSLVSGELDQAQHDVQSDLLGVAAGGMLVRRSVWTALGGFDPALPSVDAALDFCIRARLAGHRVIGVPAARVTSAGPPELFGRRSLSAGAQNRIQRSAQLHRRLAYAAPLAVPLHWLTLVPLGLMRSVVHLLAKRPGSVGGELAAAFVAAFDGGVPRARRMIRRNRVMGWAAVGALRMTGAERRERRANERAASAVPGDANASSRPGFFVGGGAWVVLLAAVAGAVAFGRFSDAPALVGGGLAPLSATVTGLWSHVGFAWHDLGLGFLGAADPFSVVLAVLGSLTFWAPSFSVVVLYLVALPLAALTAWWGAARFSTRAWPPAVAAVAWAVAPPFLFSLAEGHLGAVIAHVLLPTLVLAVVGAARNWSMSAVGGLLFAAIAACAPLLVPALVLGLLVWAAINPRGALRIVGIVIPAAALFAPLVVQQLARGDGLALFAEPGLPVVTASQGGLHLAVGGTVPGWELLLGSYGVAGLAPLVVGGLLAPLALLAILALFLPGSKRSIPAMVIALAGFLTAVAATHVQVTLVGSQPTPIWPAAALSLYWLGLVAAAGFTLEAMGRVATLPALAVSIALVLLSAPLFSALAGGSSPVVESNGRLLPAFAAAEAAADPSLGTLELTAQPDGGLAVTVHRGAGTTLDEQSTLDATDTTASDEDARLATLAGNLASRSGFDVAAELDALHVAFVLVPDAGDEALRQRVVEALDGNRILTPIGDTSSGALWHYAGLDGDGQAPTGPGPLGSSTGILVIVVQAVVFGLTLLLAIPTTRRRRVRSARVTGDEPALGEEPADE